MVTYAPKHLLPYNRRCTGVIQSTGALMSRHTNTTVTALAHVVMTCCNVDEAGVMTCCDDGVTGMMTCFDDGVRGVMDDVLR